MTRLIYEFTESFRIAFAQIRANTMRSILTALGVIIGIVAVTLMGTAINGIDIGFEQSLAMLGDDVLYVQKWPWGNVNDWWNYINRPPIRTELSDALNRVIEQTPNSLLEVSVPMGGRGGAVKAGSNRVSGVNVLGTTADYARMSTAEIVEGRMFNEVESNAGRQIVILGSTVARTTFSEPFVARPAGRNPRPAFHGDRRAGAAGRFPGFPEFRQPGDRPAQRPPQILRRAHGGAVAREGEGQDEAHRRGGRTCRGDASRARATSGRAG